MDSCPPLEHVNHLARKLLTEHISTQRYIEALDSAQKIITWQSCKADESFQEDIIQFIRFCEPLARLQKQEERDLLARKEQEAARKELIGAQIVAVFGGIAEKFGATKDSLLEDGEPSPMVAILNDLEAGQALSNNQQTWLERRKYYLTLARGLYKEFLRSSDYWLLAKVGKFLRRDEQPEKVVELLSEATISKAPDNKCKSALLTSRGAAKRDLRDLDGALEDGDRAIKSAPASFHPHTLLGAIHYQAGNPELGYTHFEEAIRLGANIKNADQEISSALDRSSPEARQKVIDYLLAKDPSRYAWLLSVSEKPRPNT